MVPIPTLDAMLARPDVDPERLRRAAERAAAAAVADWRELRAFDKAAGGFSSTAFDRATVAATRAQYETWVAMAEALRERLAAVAGRTGGDAVAGADDVRHTIGKTRAQLSVTLDDIEASAADEVAGRWISAEDLRRELRLRPQVL